MDTTAKARLQIEKARDEAKAFTKAGYILRSDELLVLMGDTDDKNALFYAIIASYEYGFARGMRAAKNHKK